MSGPLASKLPAEHFPDCCTFHKVGCYWFLPCSADPNPGGVQRPVFEQDPADPRWDLCPLCGERVKHGSPSTNFRDHHLVEDCPKRPFARARYRHAEFPEVALDEGELFYVRDPKTGEHVQTPLAPLVARIGCFVNNQVANPLHGADPVLQAFMLNLARDLEGLAILLRHPSTVSGATAATLAHWRKRVGGDNDGFVSGKSLARAREADAKRRRARDR